MAEEDGDFLSRWSRRKRAAVAEEPPIPGLDPGSQGGKGHDVPDQVGDSEAIPETLEAEAALLEKLGLPAPETLSEGDDFSRFMADGVPAFLRKRALRVLWRSNPILANLDGLNDYDEDFTSPEMTQKVLATGYQVGRGFVKKVLDTVPEAEGSTAAEETAVSEEAEPKHPESDEISGVKSTEEASDEADDESVVHRPRRMRFET